LGCDRFSGGRLSLSLRKSGQPGSPARGVSRCVFSSCMDTASLCLDHGNDLVIGGGGGVKCRDGRSPEREKSGI